MSGFLEALSQWEGPFLLWIQETLRQPWLDRVMSVFTHLGDTGLLWIALCLIMFLFSKTRKAAVAGAAALVLALICTHLTIKPLVARQRPWRVIEGLVAVVAEPDPHSFPSGHACASFACVTAWWSLLPKAGRWTAFGVGLAMALSRLYVGVHFPSDVICGILAGVLCGLAGAWITSYVSRRREASLQHR